MTRTRLARVGAVLAVITATLVATTSVRATPAVFNGKIAFVRTVANSNTEVYTVDPDGTDPMNLTPGSGGAWPSWKGDGSEVAFIVWVSGGLMMASAPDGSNKRVLFSSGALYRPRWSPDGSRFVYEADEHNNWAISTAHLIDADGTNHLKPFAAHDHVAEFAPSWLNDNELVFRHTHDNAGYVAVANADGTGAVDDRLRDSYMQNSEISRDGTHMVFDHHNGSVSRIVVANGDGTNPHLVGPEGSWPTFSPDGTQIAFSRTGVYRGIWTMALDGSNLRQVTNGPDQFPQWGQGTSAPNIPPRAIGTAKNKASLALFGDASASYDEDGSVVAYEWRWGDNSAMSTTKFAWHKYAQAGTYRVRLTVVDDDGARTTREAWVKVA